MKLELSILGLILSIGSIILIMTAQPEKLKFSVVWSILTLMAFVVVAIIGLTRKR